MVGLLLVMAVSSPPTDRLVGGWRGAVEWTAPSGPRSASIRLTIAANGVATLVADGQTAVILRWEVRDSVVVIWRRADRANEVALRDLRVADGRLTARLAPTRPLRPLPEGYRMALALKKE